jgi:SAM-dependent methyltransferase
VTGTRGNFDGRAELEELRADFPGWRISREQVGERVSYLARGQHPGANPRIAEADTVMQLRAMLEPTPLDTSRPNIARVYDYWLGGKDNYAADRAEAERLLAIYPHLPKLARHNRLFLARAVAWLAGRGIRQFLDIGCGLPTAQNTHEIAQATRPDCRVVYVDSDPVVVSHARALLSDTDVTAIRADLADPGAILADPRLRNLIDLAEPTAVVLAMVLHFFDDDSARRIVATFAEAIAPGSYLVISVGSGDDRTGGRLAREYRAGTLHNHSPAQISGFFDGLDLVLPGLTDAATWVPGLPGQPPSPQIGGHILVGVARKRAAGILAPSRRSAHTQRHEIEMRDHQMPDTRPQADVGSDQTQAPVPVSVEPLAALPSRHAFRHQPSGWRPPVWLPTDRDVLLKVRAALQRL